MSRRKQDWSPRQETTQDYDLWAVKVYEGKWVVVGIFQTREKAVRLIHEISRDHRRPFPLIEPKLTHPFRRVVALWVAAGNPIP